MIRLVDIAEPARSAMQRLRERLPSIAGESLVAIWLYGGQLQPGDVDRHVVLHREPPLCDLAQVRELRREIQSDLGIDELDVWYVLLGEVTVPGRPRDINWHEEVRDENRALKRTLACWRR